MTHDGAGVRQLQPLLFVRDIRRSVRHYSGRLGFEVVGRAGSGDEMYWCRLERGGASFMLQQADEEQLPALGAPGAVFYFVCDDVDALFGELSAKGMELEPPTVAYYEMRQLTVPDPDGYSICFETPTENYTE